MWEAGRDTALYCTVTWEAGRDTVLYSNVGSREIYHIVQTVTWEERRELYV
jgi:hypothetical protein